MEAKDVRTQVFYRDDTGGVLYVLAIDREIAKCVIHRASKQLPLEVGSRRNWPIESLTQWAVQECRDDEVPARDARVVGSESKRLHKVRGYAMETLCGQTPAVPIPDQLRTHGMPRCTMCDALAEEPSNQNAQGRRL